MNISINGQSQVPPGFRFHPTEEELLQYYLRKKVAYQKIDLDVIGEVDLNKLEPWDIQEKCRIGSTPQNDWYFFSHKDKKYPTGTRTNRATAAGFWKATGRDKIIRSGCRRIGLRKTLVFYKGRAPHGHKSEWIMHEYRLDDSNQEQNALDASPVDMNMTEEGWVVCRVFKKKNYQKSLDSPWSRSMSTSSIDSKIQMLCSSSNQNGVLDQILSYMGRKTCKVENETNVNLKNPENNDNDNCKGKIDIFMHLPRLDGPGTPPPPPISGGSPHLNQYQPFDETMFAEPEPAPAPSSDSATPETSELVPELGGLGHWATLDRLVASHLNGQDLPAESTGQYFCFGDHDEDELVQLQQIQLNRLSDTQSPQTLAYESDFFWSNIMAKSLSSSSSSDPFRHLSV